MTTRRVQRLIGSTATAAAAESHAAVDPPLLSLSEAAKRMGLGLKTLQARVADGTIFAIPVGMTGKYYKVPVAEVEKWRDGRYGTPHGSHGIRYIQGAENRPDLDGTPQSRA